MQTTNLLTHVVSRTPKLVTALASFSFPARYAPASPTEALLSTWGRCHRNKIVLHGPPAGGLVQDNTTWIDPYLYKITPKIIFVATLAPQLKGVSVDRVLLHVWSGLVTEKKISLPDPATKLNQRSWPSPSKRVMKAVDELGSISLLQVENICVQLLDATGSNMSQPIKDFFLDHGEPRIRFYGSAEGEHLARLIGQDPRAGQLACLYILKSFQHYLAEDVESYFMEESNGMGITLGSTATICQSVRWYGPADVN